MGTIREKQHGVIQSHQSINEVGIVGLWVSSNGSIRDFKNCIDSFDVRVYIQRTGTESVQHQVEGICFKLLGFLIHDHICQQRCSNVINERGGGITDCLFVLETNEVT